MSVLIIMSSHDEAKFLLMSLSGCEVASVDGYAFHVRKRADQRVIVGMSGMGPVSAALCTVAGLNRFSPSAVIVAGTARGIADGIRVGTVAMPSKVLFGAPTTAGDDWLSLPSSEPLIDNLRSCYRKVYEEYVEPISMPCDLSGPCLTVYAEVTDGDHTRRLQDAGISVVDMEGYAAYVAADQAAIPSAMVRYVSTAPGTTEADEVAAGLGAAAVDAILLRYIDSLSGA